MTKSQLNQTANIIVNEAFAFYANKFNVTVEQVKDAIVSGNKKVIDDMAELFALGMNEATAVLNK